MSRRKPDSLERIKRSARKLFVERGYDATRPQDIARDAGLGHGTFYLHYEHKRACFLDFIEVTRADFFAFMNHRVGGQDTIEGTIAATLAAIYEYSDANPGVLDVAMADEVLIDVDGAQSGSLIQQWGRDWALMVRAGVDKNRIADGFNPDILGYAIAGAIHQCRLEGDRMGFSREEVIHNLARFLARALKP
jgi:AcrR family transcriptional regulator